MGVIRCDTPHGPFSVVVCQHSGDGPLRRMLRKHAMPGQFELWTDGKIKNRGKWQIRTPWTGTDPAQSWGIVRNPWARVAIGWKTDDPDIPFPEWAKGKTLPSQAATLGEAVGLKPRYVVDVTKAAEWVPILSAQMGVALEWPGEPHHNAPWRQTYLEHPEAVGIVRERHAEDWKLGIEWETPC